MILLGIGWLIGFAIGGVVGELILYLQLKRKSR